MIVYGYRNKEIEIGTGNFYCPKCEVQRQYKHKKTVRYFTLFFVPLFPLGTLSEYVECSVCGRTYKPEILSIPSTIGSTPVLQSLESPTSPGSLQGPGFNQPVTGSKENSCLPWILILGGMLPLLAGFLMGIALIATQADGSAASGLASFILAVIICPLPLAVLGFIIVGAGVYLLRKKQDANNL